MTGRDLGVAPLFYEECILKAIALALASIAAAAALAGCANSKTPTNKDDSAFVYLLDRQGNWKENPVDTLPALPQTADLLPFNVSQNTPLKFFVDAKSLTVGSDGVVRYTVVVTSAAGARNVNYEGIRCDTYEWRQYAGLNSDHDGWDRTVENDWRRIENGELNAYHAALYQDYLCANKMPQGTAQQIVENIRFHRTAMSQLR
ncbi:CNP1-like family protein [Burkholderia multivorans]|uniref:CNP1-like family protein n=1 Tax=Burkholderia multivorans TaxID=87883 RepID=UPI001C268AF0|nr:CNP1-like family protein [Burkholderia multivorans]MBU9544579.1 CNP1-like family protein [Burkholderia multivorans]MCA8177155.1 CNP1-like family protein [Burkholderia multivorans]